MKNTPDPKRPASGPQLDVVLGALLAILVVGGLFQVFFRYAYVNSTKDRVVRIDRLTNVSCVLPCNSDSYEPTSMTPPVPEPSERAEKVCHDADIVRVAGRFVPPVTRTPSPYGEGGFPARQGQRLWKRAGIPDAVELSDGHVYVFSPGTFRNGSSYWSTGESVQVCATWSRIEGRPYYSVGSPGDADPAVLAL